MFLILLPVLTALFTQCRSILCWARRASRCKTLEASLPSGLVRLKRPKNKMKQNLNNLEDSQPSPTVSSRVRGSKVCDSNPAQARKVVHSFPRFELNYNHNLWLLLSWIVDRSDISSKQMANSLLYIDEIKKKSSPCRIPLDICVLVIFSYIFFIFIFIYFESPYFEEKFE